MTQTQNKRPIICGFNGNHSLEMVENEQSPPKATIWLPFCPIFPYTLGVRKLEREKRTSHPAKTPADPVSAPAAGDKEKNMSAQHVKKCLASLKRSSNLDVMCLLLTAALNLVLPVAAGAAATWTNTGSLNAARSSHTATLLPNGQVLGWGALMALPTCPAPSSTTRPRGSGRILGP